MVRPENPAAYSGVLSARDAASVSTSVANDKSRADSVFGLLSMSGSMGGSIDERDKPPATPPRSSGILRSSSPAAGSPSSTSHMSKECDFDKNPTKLYLMIQEKRWDDAVKQANLSSDDASTWVSRREKSGKLRWKLLPIHAAVIFKAPERVVEALLSSYPAGAQCKDDQGMLPIHLAFRNGSSEVVVNLLLAAYPQSIDVKDRKGRVPLVLAQASQSPNRDAFIRAVKRGPAYYASAAAATERAAATTEQRAMYDSKMIEMQKEHAKEVEKLKKEHAMEVDKMKQLAEDVHQELQHKFEREVESLKQSSEAEKTEMQETLMREVDEVKQAGETGNMEALEKIKSLEAELVKTQETSQVLVDHVNSLETQIKTKDETVELLTNKISALESEKEELTGQRESITTELSKERDNAVALNNALEENLAKIKSKDETVEFLTNRISALESENAELTGQRESIATELSKERDDALALNNALKANLAEKKEDLKVAHIAIVNQETHMTRAVSSSEDEKKKLGAEVKRLTMELATAKANSSVLETQIEKKIEMEQSLASQVSDLAKRYNESLANARASSATYTKRIEILERERSDLRKTVENLTNKLSGVAGALDAMATEQERIVAAAEHHEARISAAAVAQREVVEDVAQQARAIDLAKKEREEIASILARQAEDIERHSEDRKRILDAVTANEEELKSVSQEKIAVIERVARQKQTMVQLKDFELAPLIDSGRDMLEQARSTDMEHERDLEFQKTQEEKEGKTFVLPGSTCSKERISNDRIIGSLPGSRAGSVAGSAAGSVAGSVAGSDVGSVPPDLKYARVQVSMSSMEQTTTGSIVGRSGGSVACSVTELKSMKSLEEEEQMLREAEQLEQQLAQLKENHVIYSVVPLECESQSVSGSAWSVPAAPTDEGRL